MTHLRGEIDIIADIDYSGAVPVPSFLHLRSFGAVPRPTGHVPTVYLAGPIDYQTKEEATRWRNEAKKLLKANCLDPTEGLGGLQWTGDGAQDAKVVERDRRMVAEADVLLVKFKPAIPFIGTSMEIAFAHTWGKPVVMFTEGVAFKQVSPFLLYHVEATFMWLEQAAEYINTEYGPKVN